MAEIEIQGPSYGQALDAMKKGWVVGRSGGDRRLSYACIGNEMYALFDASDGKQCKSKVVSVPIEDINATDWQTRFILCKCETCNEECVTITQDQLNALLHDEPIVGADGFAIGAPPDWYWSQPDGEWRKFITEERIVLVAKLFMGLWHWEAWHEHEFFFKDQENARMFVSGSLSSCLKAMQAAEDNAKPSKISSTFTWEWQDGMYVAKGVAPGTLLLVKPDKMGWVWSAQRGTNEVHGDAVSRMAGIHQAESALLETIDDENAKNAYNEKTAEDRLDELIEDVFRKCREIRVLEKSWRKTKLRAKLPKNA